MFATQETTEKFKNQQDFLIAIEKGNIFKIKQFLEEEPELLNNPDPNDLTPLAIAIRKNKIESIELLLHYKHISFETGDDLHSDAEDYASVWDRKEIAELIRLKKEENKPILNKKK